VTHIEVTPASDRMLIGHPSDLHAHHNQAVRFAATQQMVLFQPCPHTLRTVSNQPHKRETDCSKRGRCKAQKTDGADAYNTYAELSGLRQRSRWSFFSHACTPCGPSTTSHTNAKRTAQKGADARRKKRTGPTRTTRTRGAVRFAATQQMVLFQQSATRKPCSTASSSISKTTGQSLGAPS
jgi:hypothetical protein